MSRQTILLIEDSPMTRKMLRVTLEAEDYVVLEAGDGSSALDRIRETRPDLIIQDIVLPDVDGLELTSRIRELPNGVDVPVMVLSGFAGRFDEARGASGQYVEFLLKPVTPSRLLEAVRDHLPMRGDRRRSGKGRRLLLVDDNESRRKVDVVRFVQAGFEVSVAATGEEALATAREFVPDVIVTDVIMPGIDGFELCQALRGDAQLTGIPVVLVSSHFGDARHVALSQRVGASAFLVRRPDSLQLLRSVLDAVDEGPPPLSAEVETLAGDRARRLVEHLDTQSARHTLLEEQCTRQAAELSLLGGVADALTRSTDTGATLQDVFAATLDAAGISSGALYLVAEGEEYVSLRQVLGFANAVGLENFFGHFPVLTSVLAGKYPVTLPSAAVPAAVSSDVLARAQMASLQIVPLVFAGQATGALVFGSRAHALSSDDVVPFARAIGAQIIQSLAIIRAFDRRKAAEALLLRANEELEQKVAERTRELSESNAALERLARTRQDMMATVSHDLRNPLNAISIGVAQLTGQGTSAITPVMRDRTIVRIGRAAAQMERLVTALLDVAKIEDGTLTVNRRPVPVPRLLADILEAHLPLADAKSLRLELVATVGDSERVAGDEERLAQVLSNLIGNAIKFTPAGGVIKVGAAGGDNAMTFSVADSGRGIDPDHLPHIFNRHWRADNSAPHSSGLGLAIVKGIVEAHDGRLWVDSQVGIGTTFYFSVPPWSEPADFRAALLL